MARRDDEDDESMGPLFRAMREASKEKRASNRENSAQLLREAGIPFVKRNYGAHLIVAEKWNFWPGTGLWMPIGGRKRQYGVRLLLRAAAAMKGDA